MHGEGRRKHTRGHWSRSRHQVGSSSVVEPSYFVRQLNRLLLLTNAGHRGKFVIGGIFGPVTGIGPSRFLNCFIMTSAHSVRTTEACGPQSPSNPDLPVSRDGLADPPDEISPLLGTNRTHAAIRSSQSERWHSARSSVSAFLDKNAGLSLIAAAQFFFSAMNICVKLLNSLDEPVPIFEVRVSSGWLFSDLTPL